MQYNHKDLVLEQKATKENFPIKKVPTDKKSHFIVNQINIKTKLSLESNSAPLACGEHIESKLID
jgi:hypothetical protein